MRLISIESGRVKCRLRIGAASAWHQARVYDSLLYMHPAAPVAGLRPVTPSARTGVFAFVPSASNYMPVTAPVCATWKLRRRAAPGSPRLSDSQSLAAASPIPAATRER